MIVIQHGAGGSISIVKMFVISEILKIMLSDAIVKTLVVAMQTAATAVVASALERILVPVLIAGHRNEILRHTDI